MYSVYINKNTEANYERWSKKGIGVLLLWDNDSEILSQTMSAPVLTLEANNPGSLAFKIFPSNPYYKDLVPLKTSVIVTTMLNGQEIVIWDGRVLSISSDFSGYRDVVCEGSLGFLRDSPVDQTLVDTSVTNSTADLTLKDGSTITGIDLTKLSEMSPDQLTSYFKDLIKEATGDSTIGDSISAVVDQVASLTGDDLSQYESEMNGFEKTIYKLSKTTGTKHGIIQNVLRRREYSNLYDGCDDPISKINRTLDAGSAYVTQGLGLVCGLLLPGLTNSVEGAIDTIFPNFYNHVDDLRADSDTIEIDSASTDEEKTEELKEYFSNTEITQLPLTEIVARLLYNHNISMSYDFGKVTESGYTSADFRDAWKLILPGRCSVKRTDTIDGSSLSYMSQSLDSTYSSLINDIVEKTRCFVSMTYVNGRHILNLAKESELPKSNVKVRADYNILDGNEEINGDNIFTVLYPLGSTVSVEDTSTTNGTSTKKTVSKYITLAQDYIRSEAGGYDEKNGASDIALVDNIRAGAMRSETSKMIALETMDVWKHKLGTVGCAIIENDYVDEARCIPISDSDIIKYPGTLDEYYNVKTGIYKDPDGALYYWPDLPSDRVFARVVPNPMGGGNMYVAEEMVNGGTYPIVDVESDTARHLPVGMKFLKRGRNGKLAIAQITGQGTADGIPLYMSLYEYTYVAYGSGAEFGTDVSTLPDSVREKHGKIRVMSPVFYDDRVHTKIAFDDKPNGKFVVNGSSKSIWDRDSVVKKNGESYDEETRYYLYDANLLTQNGAHPTKDNGYIDDAVTWSFKYYNRDYDFILTNATYDVDTETFSEITDKNGKTSYERSVSMAPNAHLFQTITSPELVKRFGRIVKTKQWSNCSSSTSLMSTATKYMEAMYDKIIYRDIEITMADLASMGAGGTLIVPGVRVDVYYPNAYNKDVESETHVEMICTKRVISLDGDMESDQILLKKHISAEPDYEGISDTYVFAEEVEEQIVDNTEPTTLTAEEAQRRALLKTYC